MTGVCLLHANVLTHEPKVIWWAYALRPAAYRFSAYISSDASYQAEVAKKGPSCLLSAGVPRAVLARTSMWFGACGLGLGLWWQEDVFCSLDGPWAPCENSTIANKGLRQTALVGASAADLDEFVLRWTPRSRTIDAAALTANTTRIKTLIRRANEIGALQEGW
jgi:hypothetical protein